MEEISQEIETTTVVVQEEKTINDIYYQNQDITYLLMGIVAILIIAIITRRK